MVKAEIHGFLWARAKSTRRRPKVVRGRDSVPRSQYPDCQHLQILDRQLGR